MGSKTSHMAVMSPRKWGYTKVNINFGVVRVAPSQDLVVRGELFTDSEGKVWEFYARKDDMILAYPVRVKPMQR